MRVFLDTNVVVSAIATRGLCADVLREVLARHQLIMCRELMAELERVLNDKIALPGPLILEFLQFLQQDAHVSEPSPGKTWPIKDKEDVVLLSAALNGGAELFITGDAELIEMRRVENMEIVSPRVFWEKLTRTQK